MKVTALINGRVITPMREIKDGAVLIKGNQIIEVGNKNEVEIPESTEIIDIGGAYITPGFIDLHVHGAWGGDVMNATLDDLKKISEGLVKSGVTSFVPTTLTGTMDDILKAVECVERAGRGETNGAKILGVHIEGPYFNLQQKGAQNPEFLREPKPEEYLPILDRFSSIIRVSAAPELPGSLELGRELRKRGIIASIAHTNATYQEVLQAVENGYTHVTHIFSSMSSITRVKAYRIAGVLEAALLLDELTTEMIADGHHLPPSLMKLVLKTKGVEKLCLVSDSMSAAGLGPGRFNLGGLDVIVESDIPGEFEIPTQENNFVAKLLDRSSFAGSVATMDKMLRHVVNVVGLNIKDAVKLVTINPAKIQNLDGEIGVIGRGRKADLTVFNSDFNIILTMVEGKVLYNHNRRQ